jgi:hypothetical protein
VADRQCGELFVAVPQPLSATSPPLAIRYSVTSGPMDSSLLI